MGTVRCLVIPTCVLFGSLAGELASLSSLRKQFDNILMEPTTLCIPPEAYIVVEMSPKVKHIAAGGL